MRVPWRWLASYVDLTQSPEDIARLLTASGTEVERIEHVGDQWNHIVVGKIIGLERVPRANKLQLCVIDVGGRETRIITGATNVAVGQLVPAALPGARVGHGTDVVEIQPRTFSGVASEGMLCSGAELGVTDDATGIHIFSGTLVPGTPLRDMFGDTAFDLAVTPNRPDCLSIVGVAREVAALTGQPLQAPIIELAEQSCSTADAVRVTIDEPDRCYRYVARVIKNVRVGPSPDWLAQRLRTAGLPVINNVVDVSNYVMWELGQPLHTFDLAKIKGRHITVRCALPGEPITTIDAKQRELTSDTLVIADDAGAVAVAGVMGGIDSEVSGDTRDVLIESACFEPRTIRRTRIALNLPSEASRRFERGVDREGAAAAGDRAAQLIVQTAGGEVCQGSVDVYPTPALRPRIRLDDMHVSRLLGMDIPRQRVQEILASLGFGVRSRDGGLEVDVPSFRLDVHETADLVEEVARVVGYDRVPTTLPTGSIPSGGRNFWIEFESNLRSMLVASGLTEIVTYALTSTSSMSRLLGPVATQFGDANQSILPSLAPQTLEHAIHDAVTLRNPLSNEHSSLRVTMMESTLATMAANQRRNEQQIRLFEIGRSYIGRANVLPMERRTLSIGLAGIREVGTWLSPVPSSTDYFDIKGIVDAVLARFGLHHVRYERASHPSFHPGRAAYLMCADERIGVLGEVHPAVAAAFEFTPSRYCLCEIDLEALHTYAGSIDVEGVPRFPAVVQDLALVVPEDVPAEAVARILRQSGAPLVRTVRLFDVYRGSPIGQNEKSLAFSVTFRSDDRTLTADDLIRIRATLIAAAQEHVGAILRG